MGQQEVSLIAGTNGSIKTTEIGKVIAIRYILALVLHCLILEKGRLEAARIPGFRGRDLAEQERKEGRNVASYRRSAVFQTGFANDRFSAPRWPSLLMNFK